ncbi:hypothetical protein DSLASN_43890 [Desulfoluna limicola]|uniref:Membrane iron-sulfur containing protein FtrD-like domain-containing protein n=1 Tax=Desulfoluna limicola TaxID=2810562 RepID=A0ABM7PMK0_9BACT|nr:Fe-S-containing protein [Desulfoluna limicola]BCS98757.1 hypothetical protein DSLASN_43890 [Desulfoluna limicola]
MRITHLGVSLFLWVLLVGPGCARQAPEHPLIVPTGEVLRIPVSDVNDRQVHFYTYKYDDRNINFFVRTDGKGKLRTHYDACYSCFKYKLGFRVTKDHKILCIACGLKYDLDMEMWDYIGPCAPIPLRSTLANDVIEIKLSVIHRGKKLF